MLFEQVPRKGKTNVDNYAFWMSVVVSIYWYVTICPNTQSLAEDITCFRNNPSHVSDSSTLQVIKAVISVQSSVSD